MDRSLPVPPIDSDQFEVVAVGILIRAAADRAKAQRLGIWSGEVMAPWEWRKRNRLYPGLMFVLAEVSPLDGAPMALADGAVLVVAALLGVAVIALWMFIIDQ